MSSAVLVETARRSGATVPRIVAVVGAGAFAVSGIWFVLVTARITVAAPPDGGPSAAAVRRYYQWFATTLPQSTIVIVLTLIGLFALAFEVRSTARGARALVGLASWAVTAGAAAYGFGDVFEIGAHSAIGRMAGAANAIEPVNSIAFTADTVVQTFEVAGTVLVGVGFALLALAGADPVVSGLVAVVAACYAVTQVVDPGGLDVWGAAALAIVALPVWLARAARGRNTVRPAVDE